MPNLWLDLHFPAVYLVQQKKKAPRGQSQNRQQYCLEQLSGEMKKIKKYGQLNQLESWMNEERQRLDYILWCVQTKL